MKEDHIQLRRVFCLRSIVSYKGTGDPSSMRMSLIYRVIQNDCRVTIVQRQFLTKFRIKPASGNSIRRWHAQFQKTGCVCIPELKVRIRTAIETITADMLQTVGTNSIIVLMCVESQRVHIQSTCKVCNKNVEYCSIKYKKYIYSYLKCIVYDKLLKPRKSFRITLYNQVKTPKIISHNPV